MNKTEIPKQDRERGVDRYASIELKPKIEAHVVHTADDSDHQPRELYMDSFIPIFLEQVHSLGRDETKQRHGVTYSSSQRMACNSKEFDINVL